jgi:hypothetical protein
LYSSYTEALEDAAVHSEHRKVIKCDFEPGSVSRSIDLYQREVYLSKVQAVQQQQQAIFSISSTNKNQAIFPVGIPFFKFNSIKEILEA